MEITGLRLKEFNIKLLRLKFFWCVPVVSVAHWDIANYRKLYIQRFGRAALTCSEQCQIQHLTNWRTKNDPVSELISSCPWTAQGFSAKDFPHTLCVRRAAVSASLLLLLSGVGSARSFFEPLLTFTSLGHVSRPPQVPLFAVSDGRLSY